MIRTRDFFLFIQAVAFLLLAIVVTATSWPQSNSVSAYTEAYSKITEDMDYKATLANNLNEQEARLNNLRQKIKDGSNVATVDSVLDGSQTVEATATATEAVTDVSTTTDKVKEEKIKLCSNYTARAVPQLNGSLTYIERDNQRLFLESVSSPEAVSSTSEPMPVEKIVLNLPLRTITSSFSSCLSNDVVAVTPAGTPIRNKEFNNYLSTNGDSLLGYTIDGYPLYGFNSSIKTDECGGASIDGAYRYYLSNERKAVVNCFAGIPANL